MTLDDMKEIAKQEVDGCYKKKIRGKWFEVKCYVDGSCNYKWGGRLLLLDEAKAILDLN